MNTCEEREIGMDNAGERERFYEFTFKDRSKSLSGWSILLIFAGIVMMNMHRECAYFVNFQRN